MSGLEAGHRLHERQNRRADPLQGSSLNIELSILNNQSVTPPVANVTSPPKTRKVRSWGWVELVKDVQGYHCPICQKAYPTTADKRLNIHNFTTHYETQHKFHAFRKGYLSNPTGVDMITDSKELNYLFCKWIVVRHRGFRCADDPLLRSIFEGLAPHLELLHRTQLKTEYLPLLYHDTKAKVSWPSESSSSRLSELESGECSSDLVEWSTIQCVPMDGLPM